MLISPDDFSRAFVVGWGRRDAAALAALCAEDAEMLTITGLWCEGRARIAEVLETELTGTFAQSRLVTGKGRLRPLGPGGAMVSQRFVLSGLIDAEGRDAGRVAAMLSAVLLARADGWQAATVHFVALAG
ncbi:MAG: DUF4440 domain-containing protein [Cereibacter sphaeroides]|uniref:DUF4440 domain-containing protein n=1 Tax=Cereibacter sphaeroides TaxID=1063 RepID=A0A2W5U118_CERSP|nr:MAG: DUF4440 domain-containing protein [Cereibacter sphaeroides]